MCSPPLWVPRRSAAPGSRTQRSLTRWSRWVQVLRVYDAHGNQIYDLNRIVEGHDADEAIIDLLARPQVDHLHSRNVLAGCFMFSITR
ncbi:MAG: DUF1203 domain-containing protein [Actinomycetes bacterium]